MPLRSLVWLRRDLRLNDNRALAAATDSSERTAIAFVFDTAILNALPDRADTRVAFIHQSVKELDEALARHGSRLIVLHGDPLEEIPALAARLGVEEVHASHDDDPYALARDAAVAGRLKEQGRVLRTVKDCVVYERREVLSQAGEPLKVYTPYMKAWKARFQEQDIAASDPDLTRLWPKDDLAGEKTGPIPLEDMGFVPAEPWLPAGERAGMLRLEEAAAKIGAYHELRDFPALDATSGLSAHLRFGTISIRSAFRTALSLGRLGEGPKGAEKWLNELIWREFYHMILACFPHVVDSPFQRQYAGLQWPGSLEDFGAWAEGRTGYPIVDASMRCLNQTGWMHNRLRMIAASFLTKDLLVDWRKGEEWFARKLLDFELASNNGGWQWAASTGVDAQPYFRVFNPVLQSRKFDAQGAFIRKWCPELAGFEDADIHAPWEAGPFAQASAGCVIGLDYPAPVVDHFVQKEKAIALFRSAGMDLPGR